MTRKENKRFAPSLNHGRKYHAKENNLEYARHMCLSIARKRTYMSEKLELPRRNFNKTTDVAGRAMFLIGGLLIPEVQATEWTGEVDTLLEGVSYIHIHVDSDSKCCLVNDLDLSRQAREDGYRLIMFKSNDFSCHNRASLVHEFLLDFECFGSLCMNRVHNYRINVVAVESAITTKGN